MSVSAVVAEQGPGTGLPVLTSATLPAVPLKLMPLLLTTFAVGAYSPSGDLGPEFVEVPDASAAEALA